MRDWVLTNFIMVMKNQSFGCPVQVTYITELLGCDLCWNQINHWIGGGGPQKKYTDLTEFDHVVIEDGTNFGITGLVGQADEGSNSLKRRGLKTGSGHQQVR